MCKISRYRECRSSQMLKFSPVMTVSLDRGKASVLKVQMYGCFLNAMLGCPPVVPTIWLKIPVLLDTELLPFVSVK